MHNKGTDINILSDSLLIKITKTVFTKSKSGILLFDVIDDISGTNSAFI